MNKNRIKPVAKWDEIDELLNRGVEEAIPSKKTLENKLRSGKRLKIYLGVDPSGVDLHLGHASVLNKIRQFQRLNHKVVFLIGDFTGMIGDPSGKTETRKVQTREKVKENAQQYKQQAGRIVNFSGSNPAELKYNSEWLADMRLNDFLQIARLITVPQLLKREMFQKRMQQDKDVFLLEFLYPVLQGYDSVAMNVDLEIGGSDQLFNMLVGRDLLRKMKGKEKFVLTMKLLTVGESKKMGKTEGNAISVSAEPEDLYGQIMSLPDSAIGPCFELITRLPITEVAKIKQDLNRGEAAPLGLKKKLAFTIVEQFNNKQAADRAQTVFEKKYQSGKLQSRGEAAQNLELSELVNIVDLIIGNADPSSRGEAKRLIKQGAVRINGKKITDLTYTYDPKSNDIIEIGKHRIFKITRT